MVTDTSIGFKHAFITGATGIVGSRLSERLTEIGVRVTGYARKASDYGQPVSVNQVYGDICDVETLIAASQHADVIFHLAGAVHGRTRLLKDIVMSMSGEQKM